MLSKWLPDEVSLHVTEPPVFLGTGGGKGAGGKHPGGDPRESLPPDTFPMLRSMIVLPRQFELLKEIKKIKQMVKS